jgi:hypothetical protein
VNARRSTTASAAEPTASVPPAAAAPEPSTASRPRLVTPPTPAEQVEAAASRWRGALVDMVGGSSLTDVGLLGEAVVDLSAAHPSGVAQLFAGRPTRLSNLVREGAVLPAARRRARAVASRSAEHASRYGVAPTYLAIGVATWTEPAEGAAPAGPRRNDVAALARVANAAPAPVAVPAPADAEAEAADDAPPPGTSAETVDADGAPTAPTGAPPSGGDDDNELALTTSIPVVT